MTDEPTDRALCESIELQEKLLATATKVIDDALIRVTEACTIPAD